MLFDVYTCAMRLNRYVALATGKSRRAADDLIAEGHLKINGKVAKLGDRLQASDSVVLDGQILEQPVITTVMLNKPVGYVCSRDGQGSKTIYDLLPVELKHLKPVGRLDKDSSGLLLLTNDGELANQLMHPGFQKEKVYEVEIDKPLTENDKLNLEQGVMLEDGLSRLQVTVDRIQQQALTPNLQPVTYRVTMSEGRNRQIRRTFDALGYKVTKLHRIHFGPYKLDDINSSRYKLL